GWLPRAARAQGAARSIAPGAFQPTWESLRQYRAPDWFRDAKFGIWAHWTAQCVPEQGDWYARQMYIQGHPQYEFHVKQYGHPSKFGFMELDNLWKAEKWDPKTLMDLYVKAGAKYFVALANHHDNFDCYDSSHHEWNSVHIGPKRDIVGEWAQLARRHGLRFGVTNHSGHSWHWFQTAYGYDPEGPMAGIPYDGFLTKDQGKGKWWDGLDPQHLYTGANMPMPKGLTTIKEANDWHAKHDRIWTEAPPATNPAFVDRWFLRCQELLDKYQPDLLYFDNTELPLGQAGLDIAAHFYNSNTKNHKGRLEAVLNSKGLQPDRVGTMVLDIERGRADRILPAAWQTDTCIGDWHYKRATFENHRYKTATQVIQMLADIVSKNGNLLLNIPLRGDGSIDEDEHTVLNELAAWMKPNEEAIFGTRPFSIFGEGAPDAAGTRNFNENRARAYTAEDIRFTAKGNALYAIALGWPNSGKLTIKTLAAGSTHYPHEVGRVEMLGAKGALQFTRDAQGLVVTCPTQKPNNSACVLKIRPKA
ncbi:MAG TPA: alpha-L-fucosidase, partial [Bryobacteraceae bacterium]